MTITDIERPRGRSRTHPTTIAATALSEAGARVGSISCELSRQQAESIGYALAQWTSLGLGTALSGGKGSGAAAWAVIEAAREDALIYRSAMVHLSAGTFAGIPVVARVYFKQWQHYLEVFAAIENVIAVKEAIGQFVDECGSVNSPYAGGAFKVTADNRGLILQRWEPEACTRNDLVLPDAVWASVDRHAHRALGMSRELARRGLGASSGIMLVGPPGTGKSQLSRVIAHELGDRVTILVPDGRASHRNFHGLMRLASALAPALVIVDDLDLAVGSRQGDPEILHDFLNSLDDLADCEDGVVIIASTNDPKSIDPAAVRASRFDEVIEMAPPERDGRVKILQRYLSDATEVDFIRVADATDGATGADLRDLARRAIIEAQCVPTTAGLLTAARHGRWQKALAEGVYL